MGTPLKKIIPALGFMAASLRRKHFILIAMGSFRFRFNSTTYPFSAIKRAFPYRLYASPQSGTVFLSYLLQANEIGEQVGGLH